MVLVFYLNHMTRTFISFYGAETGAKFIGMASIDSGLLSNSLALRRVVVVGSIVVVVLAEHSTCSIKSHQWFSGSNQNPGAQSNRIDSPREQMK